MPCPRPHRSDKWIAVKMDLLIDFGCDVQHTHSIQGKKETATNRHNVLHSPSEHGIMEQLHVLAIETK
jgi:hypothetical protein